MRGCGGTEFYTAVSPFLLAPCLSISAGFKYRLLGNKKWVKHRYNSLLEKRR